MLKYVKEDTLVAFSEIPDEITLCLNISNCCNACEGCHSSYLKNDVGTELTEEEMESLIVKNDGVTCICFMGEGNDPGALQRIMSWLKEKKPKLKIGLYSGRKEVNEDFYHYYEENTPSFRWGSTSSRQIRTVKREDNKPAALQVQLLSFR